MKTKLSIGLPIYNEVKFVEKTLDSILLQSFNFFEFIIVDNYSNDGTYELLKKYSKKDKRIKLFRNKKNLGLVENYNKVFNYSQGDYFSWIGAHDLYDENFFQLLINKIQQNSKISLVFSNIAKIDKENNLLDKEKNIGFKLKNSKLQRNLLMPFIIKGSGDMVCGIFKSKDLKKTTLFSKKVLNPDYLLITQISNYGGIDKVEAPLRKRRYFREDEIKFNKWSDKYITFKNRYIRNNGNVNYLLRTFPTLIMALNIFKVIYLRNRIYNPYFLFLGIYTSLIYLFKHRSSFLIDSFQFLKLK
tara:strand:- start:276 stop:1181 length:906 start_codon:yes stop_codon:yes gene_type:complete